MSLHDLVCKRDTNTSALVGEVVVDPIILGILTPTPHPILEKGKREKSYMSANDDALVQEERKELYSTVALMQ